MRGELLWPFTGDDTCESVIAEEAWKSEIPKTFDMTRRRWTLLLRMPRTEAGSRPVLCVQNTEQDVRGLF